MTEIDTIIYPKIDLVDNVQMTISLLRKEFSKIYSDERQIARAVMGAMIHAGATAYVINRIHTIIYLSDNYAFLSTYCHGTLHSPESSHRGIAIAVSNKWLHPSLVKYAQDNTLIEYLMTNKITEESLIEENSEIGAIVEKIALNSRTIVFLLGSFIAGLILGMIQS